MHMITDVGMAYDVLQENHKKARENYRMLVDHDVKSVDFMGSIGAGKTTIVCELAKLLSKKGLKVGAIAGDVTGRDDFDRMVAAGILAVNCNTGKECHLDAMMVNAALKKMDLDAIDVLFVENVGNLVCPADFPLGTDYRAVIISVTEGDDMVRKHPDIFLHSDVAALNKVGISDAVGVDPETLVKDYTKLTGGVKKMVLCDAKSGHGLEELAEALGLGVVE